MKKILFALILVLCMAGVVQADPWVVCDPQADTTGFTYIMDNGSPVDVLYSVATCSDGPCAKIVDVGNISTGSHNIVVNAYRTDAVWGRLLSPSVPFAFTRPTGGTLPTGLRLSR